jgi:hypothetical protein
MHAPPISTPHTHPPTAPACTCGEQVGQYKITYSVHTQPGSDPGGQVKANQVWAQS